MCRCKRSHSCPDHATDICLYVPFCILFVVLGSVQVVAGIYYYISIPVIKLLINIAIGCWVILTGIGTGMVSGLCSSAPRKHEFLLYCTLSVLVLNVLNLIYLEFGKLREFFGDHARVVREFERLDSPTGQLITTCTAVALILVSFIEAQLNFYLLHRCQRAHTKRRCAERKTRQLYAGGNDQSADLEYVIPKKSDLHHQNSISSDTVDHHKAAVQVHQKSWVFEATGDEDDDANYDESSVSLCSSVSPSHSAAHNEHNGGQAQHPSQSQAGAANGGTTSHGRQRRISRVSDAASERFATQMSSFSRCATPSPVPRSGQQTPTHGMPLCGSLFSPQSEYHEATMSKSGASASNRLTVDFLAAAQAKLKPIAGNSHPNQHHHDDPTSLTTQADDSPYASLLVELEHSLHEKKAAHSSFSPDNTSLSTSDNKFSSKSASSSKDLEFSKELEAALQLIQELETPSEGPYLGDTQLLQHHQNAALAAAAGSGAGATACGTQLARSDSEKTLSAAVSLPSPEAGPLVDTSNGGTPGADADGAGLPKSASMHRLVIDVRAATTTPTTPTDIAADTVGTSAATQPGGQSTMTTSATPNGKHVFSVFCNEPGSQSTSGYSSPSTSSQLTHSVRDSCETTDSDRTLLQNSFRCSSITHIQPPAGATMTNSIPGYYQRQQQPPPQQPQSQVGRPTIPAPPSITRSASSLPGRYQPHQPRKTYARESAPVQPLSTPMSPMTTFISTLNPASYAPSVSDSRTSATSFCSDFADGNPVAMTASPASRSTRASGASAGGTATSSAANKSFLLFKKRSKLMPQADFQSRIFKSECLAYLTEEELVQRHQLNRNVIRNIEMNVARRVKGCLPD